VTLLNLILPFVVFFLAFGRDNRVMLQYLMMENGLFATMAAKNAEAIKGLNPKITVWSTGSGGMMYLYFLK